MGTLNSKLFQMSQEQGISGSESRTATVGKSRGQLALNPVQTSSQTITPSMNWNRGPNTTIRTSLRGSGLGQRPLDTPSLALAGGSSEIDSTNPAHSRRVAKEPDIVSISDDSSVELAQDSNAIVLNMNDQSVARTARSNELIEISDEEEEHAPFVIDTQKATIQDGSNKSVAYSIDESGASLRSTGHRQILGASSGNVKVSTDALTNDSLAKDATEGPRKLSDLSSRDLDDQFKYALFYLDREQIDLNRAVTCLFCLEEGHMQHLCPLKECEHCGVWDEHLSQNCPQWQRCLKCRERGHDVSKCTSKLRDTSVPCDLCGSNFHLEDRCCRQWNIPAIRKPEAPIELHVCCALCGQNSHLMGDCPQRKPNGHYAAWTLQDLDPTKVINLSLQKGSRKPTVAEKWGPKPGLRIKGRAGQPPPPPPGANDNEEDGFFGLRVTEKQKSHIRLGDDRLDIKRLKLDDERRGGHVAYQPRHRDDRYPPPPAHRADDHDRYYNPFWDERRRSRSLRRNDHWRPPPSPPRAPTRPKPTNARGGNVGRGRRGGY